MDLAQQKAWDWLLPNEQNSLYLTLGTGKSSWEVGEMMKISHYKYLEIKERAEHFFKLFTNFLELYPSVFRPDGPCQEDFKDYIEGVICHRKTRKEAAQYTGVSSNLLNEVSSKRIEKNLNRLKNSDDPWDKATLMLIQEFDRWNNFRILPKMLQQPSAYKRRLNKKHKIYIRYLLDTRKMPEWLLMKLKERFYFKTRKVENKYYVALINRNLYDDGYFVLPIKKDEEVVKEMSRFYIYVFSTKAYAEAFGFKVANYGIQTSRVRLGLKFWPEYRDIVEKAVNYNSINNLDFNVKTLDMAYENIRSKPKSKRNKKKDGKVKPGMTRAKASEFYKK